MWFCVSYSNEYFFNYSKSIEYPLSICNNKWLFVISVHNIGWIVRNSIIITVSSFVTSSKYLFDQFLFGDIMFCFLIFDFCRSSLINQFSLIYLYTMEVYPTVIRAISVGFGSSMARFFLCCYHNVCYFHWFSNTFNIFLTNWNER